jgi:hypothetical protein
MSYPEQWSVIESGNLYVSGSGDGGYTKIPATKPFNAIQIQPVPLTFTAAAGSTIVASYDFLVAYDQSAGIVPEYWQYSNSFTPWRHNDAGTYTNKKTSWTGSSHPDVYVGNTPTAATSGSAASIGQNYRWETWRQDRP